MNFYSKYPSSQKEFERQKDKLKRLYAHQINEPKWDLVNSYTPLLKSIVGKMRIYFPSHVDTEDIYSIAMMGLIGASQKFDPEKGLYFGKYAALRIRGALLDELRRLDLLPRGDRIKLKSYQKAVDELQQKLNREATDEEIETHMGLTHQELVNIKKKSRPICHVPLDYKINTDEANQACLHELISDPTENNGRDNAEYIDTLSQLRHHIDQLPSMMKKVLVLYYVKGLNLSEIALAFDLTESRICQIHGQAVGVLRSALNKTD